MICQNHIFRAVSGALTLAYGTAVLTSPSKLLNPAGLLPTKSNVLLARALGVRDVLSGASLVLAPARRAEAAVGARVLADLCDVATFGVLCPTKTKAKAVAVAASWGAVCTLGSPRVAARLARVSS